MVIYFILVLVCFLRRVFFIWFYSGVLLKFGIRRFTSCSEISKVGFIERYRRLIIEYRKYSERFLEFFLVFIFRGSYFYLFFMLGKELIWINFVGFGYFVFFLGMVFKYVFELE